MSLQIVIRRNPEFAVTDSSTAVAELHMKHTITFKGFADCVPFDKNGRFVQDLYHPRTEFALKPAFQSKRFYGEETPLPRHMLEDPLDYCNASHISFVKKQDLVAAATPLESLIDNFWKVVVESETFVILNCTPDQDLLAIPRESWTTVEEDIKERKDYGSFKTSKIDITCDVGRVRKTHRATYIQMTCWGGNQTPTPQETATVLAEVNRLAGTDLPIMAVCRSGSNRSCMMLASYIQHFHPDLNLSGEELVAKMRTERKKAIVREETQQLLFSISKEMIDAELARDDIAGQ